MLTTSAAVPEHEEDKLAEEEDNMPTVFISERGYHVVTKILTAWAIFLLVTVLGTLMSYVPEAYSLCREYYLASPMLTETFSFCFIFLRNFLLGAAGIFVVGFLSEVWTESRNEHK